MKLAYCTNIWNHHQGPVCTELAKRLGPDDFKLLLHQPLDHKYSLERIGMGWNLNPPDEPWIVGPPKTCADIDYSRYVKIVMEADAIVFNSELPYITWDMLRERHRQGKLNLRMGERIYRGGRPWWYPFSPKKWIGRMVVRHRFESAGLHFLTMSHWCVDDLEYLHVCKGRTWRWGYLTPVSDKCVEKPKREKVRIGWCGRMLRLKQVDFILRAYAAMPETARAISEIHLVGNGEAEEELRQLARDLGIDGSVQFSPLMSQLDAKRFLEGLDVFVFPSNAHEGWGATLLEAMDKGCAVIANTAAGATLEVVEDGVNGFTFKDSDVTTVMTRLAWLVEHEKERCEMGRRAWATIQDWSPKAGAHRLVELVKHLQAGMRDGFPLSGLCAGVR